MPDRPLAVAPPDTCRWSSALRLNRDSSPKMTRLQSVTPSLPEVGKIQSTHAMMGQWKALSGRRHSSGQYNRSCRFLMVFLMALDV
ncbi:hypothetical protein TNCV_3594641 [Trichonephila clavipes]|nr:hypothetical protein TNCV_3594641 [Trichonephila clavipes]